MPQKYNKAGQLQEYVPAGNGDASGEYGYNSGENKGGNKHFNNFGRPSKEKIKKYRLQDKNGFHYIDEEVYNELLNEKMKKGVELIAEEYDDEKDFYNKVLNDIASESMNSMDINDLEMRISLYSDAEGVPKEYLNEYFESPEFEKQKATYYKNNIYKNIKNNLTKGKANLKALKEMIDNLDVNSDVLGLIDKMYGDGMSVTLVKNANDCYRPGLGNIVLSSDAFGESEGYSKGGVFLHESGHGIDDSHENGFWSSNYVSKETGKTLQETIDAELMQFNNEEAFQKLNNDINNQFEEAEAKLNIERELALKPYRDKKEKYESLKQQVFDNDEEYSRIKAMREELKNKGLLFSPEDRELLKQQWARGDEIEKGEAMQKFYEQYGEKSPMEEIIRISREYSDKLLDEHSHHFRKYGDLSDMIQAVRERDDTIHIGNKIFGGHDPGYFSSYRGKENQGTEAFAEIMSAKNTNPESYELLKKYIPNTLKVFEEIVGEMKNEK